MKKTLTLFFCSIFLFCSLCAEERLISLSVGLCSGVPFYSSQNTNDTLSNFSDANNRVILGTTTNINLNIDPTLTFFCGTDFLADFNWNSVQKFNMLSLDFSTGLKVYPGLGGFDLGLAYVLGYRADYLGPKKGKARRTSTPWGNGYKIFMEYNFAHEGSSRFLPTIGLCWKRMPRGNNSFDNQLTAYACLNI